MKKFPILVAVLMVFGSTSLAFGQDNADAWRNVTLGPMFMPGASINAGSVADGTKTGAQFSWCLGAVSIFPLSPNFGVQLAACYDSRGVEFSDQSNSSNFIDYTLNYFSLRPEFTIGDFLIGLGLGIPVGSSATGGGIYSSFHDNIGASSMNFLLEGRLGATIPVVTSQTGNTLRFIIEGSYAFSKITSNSVSGASDDSKNNGPIAGLQVGFAYLFNLNPK
jgi:hypothetical protein